jgi:hypothetical protein
VLDQLARSYRARRDEGGRFFVDHSGAYQKTGPVGKTVKVYFVHWDWKGDLPPKKIMRTMTLPERLMERRDKK